MKLFIDTSNRQNAHFKIGGQVYLLDQGTQILGKINNALKESNKNFRDIEEITVSLSGSSFTGLRVGMSIAQALAWSLEIPLKGESFGKTVKEKKIKYPSN